MNRVHLGVRTKAIWRGGRKRCVSSGGGGGGGGGGVERETRPLIRGGGIGGGASLPPVSASVGQRHGSFASLSCLLCVC